MRGLSSLFALLRVYKGSRVFNQYCDEDKRFDLPGAAQRRCQNLASYLEAFADAKYILVGEAAGYAGCRFSGIPFTSEAQLVGPQRLGWTLGTNVGRSSLAPQLWCERSAQVVWEALGQGRSVLLWNAFPWHPYGATPLSNRCPGPELSAGLEALTVFLALFPDAQPCAVGHTAHRALRLLGIEAPYIRHPSHGGRAAFLAGISALSVYPR